MQPIKLTLRVDARTFAVCQLPPDSSFPVFSRHSLFSITQTAEELSVICEESDVPALGKKELGWRCFSLQGEFPFELTGILLSVLKPLADAKIGIFAFSTFNTDYVLVKEENLERALQALIDAGHSVERP
jgi:hypothetical protein